MPLKAEGGKASIAKSKGNNTSKLLDYSSFFKICTKTKCMPIVLPVGRIILTTTVNSSFGQSQAVSSLYVKLKNSGLLALNRQK